MKQFTILIEKHPDGYVAYPLGIKGAVLIEKHPDGYVAYPLGIKGAVVGQGDTYEEALADAKSAIRCYVEIFGKEMLEDDSPVIEAFLTEAEVAV